jgi:hypothetical protein
MTCYVNGVAFSTYFNAMAFFYNVFDVGAIYLTDQSAVGLVKFTLNKRLVMGLAYEYSLKSQLFNTAKGTTELFLQFKL